MTIVYRESFVDFVLSKRMKTKWRPLSLHRVNSLNFLQHPSDKIVSSSVVSAPYSVHASSRAKFSVGRVDGTSGLPHLQCKL